MNLIDHTALGELSTFVPNKNEPVYDWFYYKEGYSKKLVDLILGEFRPRGLVLDPFAGVGTTLLACKQQGLPSVGFDPSPLAVFASRVKLADYDVDALRAAVRQVTEYKTVPGRTDVGKPSQLVKRAFAPRVLEDVASRREAILGGFEDEAVRNFLMLGLINASMKCSHAYKDGAVIKFTKDAVPPLNVMLRRTLYKMVDDVRGFKATPAKAEARLGDAREIDLPDASVSAVITSPPYLNKIEYSKVYSIELELFFQTLGVRDYEKRSLHSYFGMQADIADYKNPALAADDPLEAYAYFMDMERVLDGLQRVCAPGARLAIVIGQGCYPDRVIKSDEILAAMAERKGFEAGDLWVLNKRICTRQRTIQVGPMHESIVFLTRQE